MDFGALTPPIQTWEARNAFLNAHLIRRRFTLGDLLQFSGCDTETLWDRVSSGLNGEI
jgi:hypothetical protein